MQKEIFIYLSILFLILSGCSSTLGEQTDSPDAVLIKEVYTTKSGETSTLDYYYNHEGQLVQVFGQVKEKMFYKGNITYSGYYGVIYKYDDNGLLKEEAEAHKDNKMENGAAISYKYNDQGLLEETLYEDKQQIELTKYFYNQKGLLERKSIVSTDKNTEDGIILDNIQNYIYKYDEEGKLLLEIEAWDNSRYINYKKYIYNDDNTVDVYSGRERGSFEDAEYLTVKYEDTPSHTYEYDENGNLISYVTHGYTKVSYSYDNAGRVIKEEKYSLYRDTLDYTIEYVYGKVKNKNTIDNPDYVALWPDLVEKKDIVPQLKKSLEFFICPECNGTGRIVLLDEHWGISSDVVDFIVFDCAECYGRGKVQY